MKLKTEMQDRMNDNGKRPIYNDGGIRPERAMAHDAAAAHALMQAIKEAEPTLDDEYVFPSTALGFIRQRADNLMREWGFES